MERIHAKIGGLSLMVFGIFILINSSVAITGAIVFDDVVKGTYSLFGFLILVAGLILFALSYEQHGTFKKTVGDLEKLVTSRRGKKGVETKLNKKEPQYVGSVEKGYSSGRSDEAY